MTNAASTNTINIVPVQGIFGPQPTFTLVNLIGPAGTPFYPNINPAQSGLHITNSTIDSSVIGGISPSLGTFTNIATTTGTIANVPVAQTDIANKLYVDSTAAGLAWKQPVVCATTTSITLSGLQTIDTVTVAAGDRVLVKNQSNPAQNGLYIASTGAWTYAIDGDAWNEYVSAICFIESGSQAGSAWYCYVQPGGTLGVTPITWSNFSTSAIYSAGTGLTLTGYQFSISNIGTAGTYGSASQVPVFVTNAQGQVTSVTNTLISIANTQVTGLGTMSTQNANNVSITGGSITGTPISGSTVGGSTITASTQFNGPGTGLTGTATSLNIGGNAATATTATTATTAVTATTATNLAGGTAGSIGYQTAANTTAMLAAGTGVLVGGSTPSYSTTPTLTGTNFTGIPNGALLNSSFTLGTTSIALGSTTTVVSGLTLSGATIDNAAPYLNFTPTTAPAYQEGRLFYDSSAHTLNYYNDNSQMSLNIGQENVIRVRNQTGTTITNGQVVYINGATGNTPTIALAIATSFAASDIIGVATTDIANNGFGYITTSGLVNNLDTSAFADGNPVFLSATTAGAFTTVEPTNPNYSTQVGVILRANPSVGTLLVSIQLVSTEVSHVIGTLSISQGGTNGTATPTSGAVAYGTGTAYGFTSAGTTGQVLTSSGTGTPTWTTPTSYATVTDDTTTNATRYPLFASTTAGNLSTEYVSSTKYQFNPSTGLLTATGFSGSGANLTSIPNGALVNSSVTIGSTAVALGATVTTFAGLTSVTSTTFVGALSGNASTATTATTATNATNIAITDNTVSASTYYPVISSATSGNTGATTSSTKLSFVPSTGVLSATSFAGAGAFTTLTTSSTVTLNGGTANGVAYLNGSKVLTTGAALTYDGTTFTSGAHTLSAGNLTFGTTGQRITGDFSNATIANRVMFQTSTANGGTTLVAIPNGTSTTAQWQLINSSSDLVNNSYGLVRIDATSFNLRSEINGTGSYLPMTFYTGGSERVRIATTGGVSVGSTTDPGAGAFSATGGITVTGVNSIGYGAGSGGVVTQATSKSTAVTLNKPVGQITMNNAALASGASVEFTVNNTLVTTSDTLAMNVVSYPSYVAQCKYVNSGSFIVRVTNTSGGSLSEALILNFAILKGATA